MTNNAARFPFLKRAFLKGISPQLRQALINFDYNNYEELVGKAINIDAQQAAERNETLTNKADFVRAVSSVESQTFATDKLLASLSDLNASIASLKEKPRENNFVPRGRCRG